MIHLWNKDIPNRYQEAKDYLAGGRKKYDRPMYWRYMRMRETREGGIALYTPWLNQDVVKYNPDDTLTIQLPSVRTGWGYYNTKSSQSLRAVLATVGGFNDIRLKNGVLQLYPRAVSFTAPKVQGCRQCKQTGLVDMYCSPRYCYGTGQCGEQNCVNTNNWHRMPCAHGNMDHHNVPRGTTCIWCNGTRKRDYGSKIVTIPWDGSPLRVKDGEIVKTPLTELEKALAAYVKVPN